MKAVWNKELRTEKNHTLAFVYQWNAEKGDTLHLAASNLYRIFANGTLIGYGPARAPHGYSRVDSYDFSSYHGKIVRLVLEVFASNINTYYIVDELPFFGRRTIAKQLPDCRCLPVCCLSSDGPDSTCAAFQFSAFLCGKL